MSKILQLYRDNASRAKQPVNVVRNASEASLYIYDIIDPYWGVSAVQVIDAVTQAGDAEVLHVYINSPGGDVFEGRAIMAALSRFGGKTIAHIDSLCASAATSIALACNEVEMMDGAFFMIHNASGWAWGDKNDLRETADLLEKVEGSIVADYVAKTGKSEADILAWMNAETWFTATEALDNGFIDRITPAPADKAKVGNVWNLAAFQKAPQALTNQARATEPPAAASKPEPKNITTMSAAETEFMKSLMPHYQAAVDLAKAALPNCENDAVIEFVEDVIEDHAGNLELMEVWCGTPGAPEESEQSNAPSNSATQSNKNRLTLLLAS